MKKLEFHKKVFLLLMIGFTLSLSIEYVGAYYGLNNFGVISMIFLSTCAIHDIIMEAFKK